MRHTIVKSALFALITLLAGCAAPHRGPAYGHEGHFRQLLVNGPLVKECGYKVEDVRFSDDCQKALVFFSDPAETNALRELLLEHDGFRRYVGNLMPLPFLRPENPAAGRMHRIIVTLPAK